MLRFGEFGGLDASQLAARFFTDLKPEPPAVVEPSAIPSTEEPRAGVATGAVGGEVGGVPVGLRIAHLQSSVYGRTLIAKVVVFGIVLTIGAYNRYWLVPEMKAPRSRTALLRNVGVESLILLVGVLALAALLANTPPVHNHTG